MVALVILGAAFGSPPVHAQAPGTWTLDVGVGFSPWFGTFTDAICCRAISGWVGLRKGRLGIQFEHVGGWSNAIHDHFVSETELYEQTYERHRNRITTGLVDYEVFRSRRVILRLHAGLGVRADNEATCYSRRGEPFTDEELEICEEEPVRPVWHGGQHAIQGGISIDFAVNEYGYIRMETRFWEVRLGAGIAF